MRSKEYFEALYERLKKPFPQESLVVDTSRGDAVALVGPKGAYVIERLNEAIGICGVEWTYSKFTYIAVADKLMMAAVCLQFRVSDEEDLELAYPRYVVTDQNGTLVPDESSTTVWSAPIESSGNMSIIRGRVGDAAKGAVTNGIGKAASMLGVAIDAYKGMYAFEDGEIVMVAKQGNESMDTVMGTLEKRKDFGLMELMRDASSYADQWVVENIAQKVVEFVSTSGLSDFLKDNKVSIIGRDAKPNELTVGEYYRIYAVIGSIKSGKVKKEDALNMLPKWDGVSDWVTHCNVVVDAEE